MDSKFEVGLIQTAGINSKILEYKEAKQSRKKAFSIHFSLRAEKKFQNRKEFSFSPFNLQNPFRAKIHKKRHSEQRKKFRAEEKQDS